MSRGGPLSGETHTLPERLNQVCVFFCLFCKSSFCVTGPSTLLANCAQPRPVTGLPLYVLGMHTTAAETWDHTGHDPRNRGTPMSSADATYTYYRATARSLLVGPCTACSCKSAPAFSRESSASMEIFLSMRVLNIATVHPVASCSVPRCRGTTCRRHRR